MFSAASWAISVYYAYQRTWKPFNPILGETYEMVNHGGITFISEQVRSQGVNFLLVSSVVMLLDDNMDAFSFLNINFSGVKFDILDQQFF